MGKALRCCARAVRIEAIVNRISTLERKDGGGEEVVHVIAFFFSGYKGAMLIILSRAYLSLKKCRISEIPSNLELKNKKKKTHAQGSHSELSSEKEKPPSSMCRRGIYPVDVCLGDVSEEETTGRGVFKTSSCAVSHLGSNGCSFVGSNSCSFEFLRCAPRFCVRGQQFAQ